MSPHKRSKFSAIQGLLSTAFSIACIVLLLEFAVPRLSAQIQEGSLTGTTKDSSGAAVRGVSVTLTNDATGVSQHAVSSSTGTYVFSAVDAGTYGLPDLLYQ